MPDRVGSAGVGFMRCLHRLHSPLMGSHDEYFIMSEQSHTYTSDLSKMSAPNE